MNEHSLTQFVASASYGGALWLMAAGIGVVVILVVAFFVGTRHSSQRRISKPAPQASQARRDMSDPARKGEGWSTPDADPEQGHPHR
ncbi:DUF6479 family protein [Streptomyces sp. NPDC048489]|uniref:DUF6479 family protein n=1 Tax=Streptomyces sp. NPDC048489 TaxID=3154504 RepID=UPI00341FFD45